MKRLFCAVLLILLCFSPIESNAGLRSVVKSTGSKVKSFIVHPQTCKWGFRAFWLLGRGFSDALVDAHRWDTYGKPGNGTRIIHQNNWHIYKNLRDVSTLIAGGFMGLALGQKHITVWQGFKRFAFTSMVAFPMWRQTYTYSRWGNWWDTSKPHNQNLIPYPKYDLTDGFVSMHGNQVSVFYASLYFIGFGGMLWRDSATQK